MFDVLTLRDKKYGTPLQEFDRVIGLQNGDVESIATINLAATSAIELRKEIGSAAVHSIFVLPECWDDIERQMRDKGIPESQIQERRAAEPTDLTLLPSFDRIIVNPYGEREKAFRNAAAYVASITGITLATDVTK
jgi:guanylate kinase